MVIQSYKATPQDLEAIKYIEFLKVKQPNLNTPESKIGRAVYNVLKSDFVADKSKILDCILDLSEFKDYQDILLEALKLNDKKYITDNIHWAKFLTSRSAYIGLLVRYCDENKAKELADLYTTMRYLSQKAFLYKLQNRILYARGEIEKNSLKIVMHNKYNPNNVIRTAAVPADFYNELKEFDEYVVEKYGYFDTIAKIFPYLCSIEKNFSFRIVTIGFLKLMV